MIVRLLLTVGFTILMTWLATLVFLPEESRYYTRFMNITVRVFINIVILYLLVAVSAIYYGIWTS